MGAVVDNLAKGGVKPKGVGDVLQGGDAGSTSFRVGDVGDDPCMGWDIEWFNTWYLYGSLGGSPSGFWTEVGSTHLWRQRCRRQGLKRLSHVY